MPLSGEAIRTMNYVDDISVTLRRILAVLPSLTDDERSAATFPLGRTITSESAGGSHRITDN